MDRPDSTGFEQFTSGTLDVCHPPWPCCCSDATAPPATRHWWWWWLPSLLNLNCQPSFDIRWHCVFHLYTNCPWSWCPARQLVHPCVVSLCLSVAPFPSTPFPSSADYDTPPVIKALSIKHAVTFHDACLQYWNVQFAVVWYRYTMICSNYLDIDFNLNYCHSTSKNVHLLILYQDVWSKP